jgi:hypothetical protein
MTTPYTPVATNHATITLIEDSDEPSGALFSTPLEELADNIACARSFASYVISGAGVVHDDVLTLTEFEDPGSEYTLAANAVEVPENGHYLVMAHGSYHTVDTADNVGGETRLMVGASIWTSAFWVRAGTSTSGEAPWYLCAIVNVTIKASQVIKLVFRNGTAATAGVSGTDPTLLIKRL